MFELETMTKAKALEISVLAKKDRGPDELPGLQFVLQATLSADVLSMLDGALKGQLYRKAAKPEQGNLEGMEALELTPTGEHVKRLKWEYEQTGCTVEIDHGTGGKRNITLTDCRVHRLQISPRAGGSVILQWVIDAPNLSDERRGKITAMKATEIQLTIAGPDPAEEVQ